MTYNMVDLVHQHWKRHRICKIKCKGVPTVDMDNVCNVLEVWASPFFRTEAKFLYGLCERTCWIWREELVVLKWIEFVVFHVQEKSGGQIILRQGGVVYLFRGRNYNTKTRPVIPLMLWKPPTLIYPKLIEKAPAGLSLEEANSLQRLGRKLEPICHLGETLEVCVPQEALLYWRFQL